MRPAEVHRDRDLEGSVTRSFSRAVGVAPRPMLIPGSLGEVWSKTRPLYLRRTAGLGRPSQAGLAAMVGACRAISSSVVR